MAQRHRRLHVADVALLDEIAETILPETSTPGAKAAKAGAFMALMVTEAYTSASARCFSRACGNWTRRAVRHMRPVHAGARRAAAVAAWRRSIASRIRRWRIAIPKRRVRAPAAAPASDEPAHYFRMMKELTLLGYFTSEIGYTRAMRYIESPGRFDP